MCIICNSFQEYGDFKDARLMIAKAAGEPNSDIPTEHLIDLTLMLDDKEDDHIRRNNS